MTTEAPPKDPIVIAGAVRTPMGGFQGSLKALTAPQLGAAAIAAAQRIKEAGAKSIKFACLLAAPEGIDAFSQAHPDIPVYTAAVDRELNDHGYIMPGLGDAGDRMYGTK